MKTIKFYLILAVLPAIMLMSFSTKKAGSEKHYTYCYAANHDTKTLYVSDIIACYFDDASSKKTTITKKNARKSALHSKWLKKVSSISSRVDTDNVMYWDDSYNEVDEAIDEIIADYKKDDYRIKYISSFGYSCD